MSADTPTTEEVRDAYCWALGGVTLTYDLAGEAPFDRWKAANDAEVAAKALQEAADDFRRAAAAGIEPALNLTAATLLERRATREKQARAFEQLRALEEVICATSNYDNCCDMHGPTTKEATT